MFNYLTLLVVFLFSTLLAVGQTTLGYKTVDRLTYQYFINSEWDSLVSIGNRGIESGLDYHYLNVRMGIAYTKLSEPIMAEKYLQKAVDQNKGSEFAQLNLYSNALNTGNYFLLAETAKSIQSVELKPTKWLSSVTIEGGIKLSANTDSAGNLNYFSVGIGHFPAKRIALYQSYTYVTQQNNSWGNFNQHQYYLGSSIKINRYWQFNIAAHASAYNANVSYLYNDSIYTKRKPPHFPGDFAIDSTFTHQISYKGDFIQNSIVGLAGISKYSGFFRFSFFTGFNQEYRTTNLNKYEWDKIELVTKSPMTQDQNNTITKDTTIEPVERNNVSQFIAGAMFSYTFPFLKEGLTLGSNFYQTGSIKQNKLVISPFVQLKLRKKNLYVSYFQKGESIVAENFGMVLINTYDVIHGRINASIDFPLGEKTRLGFLYQWEDKTDNFTQLRYQSTMISSSFKIIF